MRPPKPSGDGPDYEVIGYNVSRGNGWAISFADEKWQTPYRMSQVEESSVGYAVQLTRIGPLASDTNRPPLLPLIIGAVYQWFPRGPIAFATIRILLATCLSLGCALGVAWGYALATKHTACSHRWFGNAVAFAIVGIVYTERNLRNYATDFLTEPIALLATQTFVMVACMGIQRRKLKWACMSGIAFAAMIYCRTVFVLWTPFVLIWLIVVARVGSTLVAVPLSSVTIARWMGVFSLTVLLICFVWWIRNCIVLQSFHPLGTKGSVTLLGGYCDESLQRGGEWQMDPEKRLRHKLEKELPTETERDSLNLELKLAQEANTEILDWSRKHCLDLPKLMFKRLLTEWNPYTGKALLIKLFAIAGITWLIFNNRFALIALMGPLVINSLLVMGTYSVGGRFLVPTYGMFYILAAFGLAASLTIVADYLNLRIQPNKSPITTATAKNGPIK